MIHWNLDNYQQAPCQRREVKGFGLPLHRGMKNGKKRMVNLKITKRSMSRQQNNDKFRENTTIPKTNSAQPEDKESRTFIS
jgi:hypothetical protein